MSIQPSQARGSIANESRTTQSVTPSAVRRERHSPRAANHSSPTPGVSLVMMGRTQAAGQRSPRTIAAAIRRSSWPIAMLMATGASAPRKNARQPASQYRAAASSAVHTAMNTGSGRAVSGEMRWAKAGE
jgi:hypothetical protein